MVQLTKDIQPRGIASAYVVTPFDEGKKILDMKLNLKERKNFIAVGDKKILDVIT